MMFGLFGAQPEYFRYFLTLNNERRQLVYAPKGWDEDTIVGYKKSDRYRGMTRSLSLPLQFVYDGATILRAAYSNYGVEAEVRIEVEELVNKSWGYKPFFVGDIDFSQYKDFGTSVGVTLMEGGATRNIKAYEGVKFEYPLTGNDVVDIKLPGVAFTESALSLINSASSIGRRYIPESQVIGNAFQSGFVTVQNTLKQDIDDTGFSTSPNWFVKANRDQEIRIQGYMKGYYNGGPVGLEGFSIEIKTSDNGTVQQLFRDNTRREVNFDFTFDISYTLLAGKSLFFYCRIDSGNGPRIFIDDSQFTVSYKSVSDESNCKGINASDLYKRIMRKVTPGTPAKSFLLENNWKDLIFTSGDGIREIENAKIKISWSEFFDTISGIDDAGFGIENNTSVLEAGTYFYRNIQSINFGDVKDVVIEPAENFIFNKLKVGYNDGNTDETNGREEYNSKQEWALPITRVQSEMDWMSPARADQYGIEKIRVEYNVTKEKRSNDTSSDNDTFMLDCYLDGLVYRPVLGSTYESVTGLTSPGTAYNLKLTPKDNLLRHSGLLRSVLDRLDGRYIAFGSGTKNTELSTVKNGIRVKQNEDIVVSSLQGKYFLPIMATFASKVPKDSMWLMDSMPYGYGVFKYRGQTLKGFILELEVNVAKNTEKTIKVLLTPENDLTTLIH